MTGCCQHLTILNTSTYHKHRLWFRTWFSSNIWMWLALIWLKSRFVFDLNYIELKVTQGSSHAPLQRISFTTATTFNKCGPEHSWTDWKLILPLAATKNSQASLFKYWNPFVTSNDNSMIVVTIVARVIRLHACRVQTQNAISHRQLITKEHLWTYVPRTPKTVFIVQTSFLPLLETNCHRRFATILNRASPDFAWSSEFNQRFITHRASARWLAGAPNANRVGIRSQ